MFSLVKRKPVENLSEDIVENRAADALRRFRVENGLSDHTKVFIIIGQYADMRESLKAEGWVENQIESFDNLNDYRCYAFNLCYTTKSRDCFRF